MFACLIWRRRRRRRNEEQGIELQPRQTRNAEEQTREAAALLSERMWVRASARWKASAKQAARRRRGPRISAISRKALSTLDRELNRHSSSSLIPPRPSTPTEDIESPNGDTHATEPDIVSPSSRLSSSSRLSPPAYVRRPSAASSHTSDSEISLADELLPNPDYISSAAAHVATDDKAVLARLEELASAPPSTEQLAELQAEESSSAPVLYEDSVEDLTMPLEYSSSNLLPPPPSTKGSSLDYSSPFDDEFAPEPSAPPFEANPSAPPMELVPSAPSFDGEEETEVIATAPPLDDEEGTSRLTLPGYQP